jgi:Bacterial Ig-like domain
MMAENKFINGIKTRSWFLWGLVLFMMACAVPDQNAVVVIWKEAQAVGLSISRDLVPGFSKDSSNQLQVQLINNSTPILGEYEIENDRIEFTPLVAFTRGLQYKLIWKGQVVHQLEIPLPDRGNKPTVLAVFPSGDSLPENLLKIYIMFSKPMREGYAMQNIVMIRNGQDTLTSVFLDLNNELWNAHRTILTVWLDPGRIKRHLQPNDSMGPPLQAGNRYQILVKQNWEDAEGISLGSGYRKDFLAVERDGRMPDRARWAIHLPKAKTFDPLRIEFHESLDYMVMGNAITILDDKGNAVGGSIETDSKETGIQFTPEHPWPAGKYTLQIEPRLEDLAGNNLERLFDKDLLTDSAEKKIITTARMFLVQ